ncbi:hypothetical protein [Sphingobacterium endophyticum]|uniref:hypothetical protein n=1 Tax=Sphingobacterium endophyticum TaxID=2546448 RepID=UPI0012E115F3|nr:hypothetical protein [Sphingobacterium endophyticum]
MEDPSFGYYKSNATTDKRYDFKSTNGTDRNVYGDTEDYYSGMPIQTKMGRRLMALQEMSDI